MLLLFLDTFACEAYVWSFAQHIGDRYGQGYVSQQGGLSIAVDSQGKWHVVYDDWAGGSSGPTYIKYINSESLTPSIISMSSYGLFPVQQTPGIAVDRNDALHVAYYASGEIMYKRTKVITHVLSVGVDWGSSLRGDLDASNLSGILWATLPSVVEPNVLHLDPSVGDGSNLASFEAAFGAIVEDVNCGDTIILSFASHGESDVNGPEPPFITNLEPHPLGYGHGPNEVRTGDEYVLLADEDDASDDSDRLYDDALHTLLGDERLAYVRKILVFDNCRSGGLGPDLTSGISNIAVLAGCNEGYFTFSARDGTGVFTNAIVQGLGINPADGFPWADGVAGGREDGTVTVDELAAYVEDEYSADPIYDHPDFFGDLIGQELPLRYLAGTGIFSGLEVDFTASDDFVGGFEGRFPGDITNDRKVDAWDFTILAAQWLEPPGTPSADIAPDGGDGFVDFRDVGKLVDHWLEGTTP